MIDIKKAEKEFEKYVSLFNPKDIKIKLKIDHIKRVSKLSKMIAENLKLNEEQVKLAQLIGLFHDIGRFKQIQLYNTFNDKDSVDHAELSIKTLFDDNLIEKFDIDCKYRKTIEIAVRNHNKNRIEEGISKEEMLFSKIIRDADKLDIYYIVCTYNFEELFWYQEFDCERISDKIIKEFVNQHFVNYSNIKTNADQIIIFYAYVFDLYFEISRKYIISKKYLEKITKKIIDNFTSIKVKQQVQEILQTSKKFLENM